MVKLDAKIPEGPLALKWTNYKASQNLFPPIRGSWISLLLVRTGCFCSNFIC